MKRETVIALLIVFGILLAVGSVDIEEVDHDIKTAHLLLND